MRTTANSTASSSGLESGSNTTDINGSSDSDEMEPEGVELRSTAPRILFFPTKRRWWQVPYFYERKDEPEEEEDEDANEKDEEKEKGRRKELYISCVRYWLEGRQYRKLRERLNGIETKDLLDIALENYGGLEEEDVDDEGEEEKSPADEEEPSGSGHYIRVGRILTKKNTNVVAVEQQNSEEDKENANPARRRKARRNVDIEMEEEQRENILEEEDKENVNPDRSSPSPSEETMKKKPRVKSSMVRMTTRRKKEELLAMANGAVLPPLFDASIADEEEDRDKPVRDAKCEYEAQKRKLPKWSGAQKKLFVELCRRVEIDEPEDENLRDEPPFADFAEQLRGKTALDCAYLYTTIFSQVRRTKDNNMDLEY